MNGLVLSSLNVYDGMSHTSMGRRVDDLGNTVNDADGYDRGTCMPTRG